MLLSLPVQRLLSLSAFLAILLSACNPIAATIPPPQTEKLFPCPLTQPLRSPYTAPAPYLNPPEGYFWHGSETLWTGLPNDGLWRGLPHNADGFRQKFLAWRVGYDPTAEPQPALTVSGERLDANAPPLTGHVPATHALGPDIHSAMLTGITFPTSGCWEVTARYTAANGDNARLTFVVNIDE